MKERDVTNKNAVENTNNEVFDTKKSFTEPKLTFIEPKLTKHGDATKITGQGFFGQFSPL